MTTFNEFSLLILIFNVPPTFVTNIARTSCASETVFFISEVNHKLKGTVLQRLQVRDVDECMDECLMNEKCQSINGFRELSTIFYCELLEDERAGSKSFEHKKGWIYYDTGHEHRTMLSSRCQLLPYNPCYPCKCIDSCEEDIEYKCLCIGDLVKDQPYVYISFEKTSNPTETIFSRGSVSNGINKIILAPPTVIKTLPSTGQRVVSLGGQDGGVHLGECHGCHLMYPDYLTVSFWAYHPDTEDIIAYYDGTLGSEECGTEIIHRSGRLLATVRTTRGFTRVSVGKSYEKMKGWRHIVMTYSKDQGLVTLYLDAVQIANRTQDSNNCTLLHPTKLYLGRYAGQTARSQISMDDFAVWNRTLSLKEIQYIYGLYDIPKF